MRSPNFTYSITQDNRSAGDNPPVSATQMKRQPARRIDERSCVFAIASGERRAAGVRDFRDLNHHAFADHQPTAVRKVLFTKIKIDNQIIARQRHRLFVARDMPQDSRVHQRDLIPRIGPAVIAMPRLVAHPAIAIDAALACQSGGRQTTALAGLRPHNDQFKSALVARRCQHVRQSLLEFNGRQMTPGRFRHEIPFAEDQPRLRQRPIAVGSRRRLACAVEILRRQFAASIGAAIARGLRVALAKEIAPRGVHLLSPPVRLRLPLTLLKMDISCRSKHSQHKKHERRAAKAKYAEERQNQRHHRRRNQQMLDPELHAKVVKQIGRQAKFANRLDVAINLVDVDGLRGGGHGFLSAPLGGRKNLGIDWLELQFLVIVAIIGRRRPLWSHWRRLGIDRRKLVIAVICAGPACIHFVAIEVFRRHRFYLPLIVRPFPLSGSSRIVASYDSLSGRLRLSQFRWSHLIAMSQFLITAIGSYGDVHPMVGLSAALAARGHDVKIVTNPYFADVVASAGLEMLPIGTAEDYVTLSQHPDLWHPIRGSRLVLKHAAGGLLRPLYDILRAHYVPGETMLCAHGLDLASRVAGDKLGAPVASVDLAPSMLWSIYDSPRLFRAITGPRVPKLIKRLQFWAADTLFIRPLLGGELNDLRRELGLAPVKRIFAHWMHDTDLVLGMFPNWFGPPQPDWPDNVRLVGFPLWDAAAGAELPGDVQEFLAAGTPPIAFSPGSANRSAAQFFAAAVEACETSGRRGILLTKYAEQLPEKLPPSVRHFGFVPLSKLLPRAAALVHHGGIGSCAQGFAAGVPHLARPMAFDQFDNSRRLVQLGVDEEISVRKFRGPAIAEALDRLLNSSTVAARCGALAAKCNGPASIAEACDALEGLARHRPSA
jgi:rhamnosyltransferase subunit B